LFLFSLIQAAGWPIWFLIITSLVAVALIVERFLALNRAKIIPEGLVEEVLLLARNQQLNAETANRLAQASPLGKILAAGVRQRSLGRLAMREGMESAGRLVAHQLERFLPALGTIATVAPLLGLFGTVVGMIEIFHAQGPSGSNPQQLGQGISTALYNTAFGILIAVPVMIFYRVFRSKVDGYLVEMEQAAARLADALSSLKV
jgi:biopolymer transport protein ExbB